MKLRILFFLFIFSPALSFAQLFSYDFGTWSNFNLTGTGEFCAASPNFNTSLGCTSYGWAGSSSTSYITTKSIALPAGTSTLSFNYKYPGFFSFPTIQISTTGCFGAYTTIATLTLQNSCAPQVIDLSAYQGQTVNIKFKNNTSSYTFTIDDIVVSASGGSGTSLWSQDFTGFSWDMGSNSNFTRSNGSSYSCVLGDYVFYTNSSNARFQTNTINIPQDKGIQLSFDSYRTSSSAGNVKIYYNITGYCSFDYMNPNDNSWVKWGEITPNTGTGTGNCTTQSMSLESYICGGQNISVCLWCPNASSFNRISIDNIDITDGGPTTVPTPIIVGATTYTENFTTDRWYGPVSDAFTYDPTGVVMPYKSRKSASDAYVYLWNSGANGMGNHSGTWSDYYAGFYTGFDFCGTSGGSQMITKELNTSTCAAAEVKYAWKSLYPCGGGANYSYTFDEDFTMYAPELYTSSGQGYTWIQQAVNYYFPDALWHYASYSVPSAANIKIRFERGGFCTNPVEGIDDIKVFCRDCSISSLSGGTITGESTPANNTDYVYSITPTAGATYYKWMIRAIDRTPTEVIEAACPNGTDPCIVSGQGTTSCTINFGSTSENFRVMCIPFDANPGSLAFPSDACYAKISLFPTAPLPVEWGYFKLSAINNDVLLEWQTMSETNCARFEVEKSTDRINFHSIYSISGAGNSNQANYYAYLDENIMPGNSYYRIKQIDFDGNSTYSDTRSIISENPEQGIEISSVFSTQIHISSMLDILYPLEINIYDLQGRIVKNISDFTLSAGESYFLPAEELNEGIYLIRLYGIGVDKKVKIIKTNLMD